MVKFIVTLLTGVSVTSKCTKLISSEAKSVLVILSIGTNFNPTIPGASNPLDKNRVMTEFA